MVYENECESQDSGSSAEILISYILLLIINLWPNDGPIITTAVLFLSYYMFGMLFIEKGRGEQAGYKPMKGCSSSKSERQWSMWTGLSPKVICEIPLKKSTFFVDMFTNGGEGGA